MNEIEATLVICSKKAERVAQCIGKLESMGVYSLVPQKPRLIRDTYLDTKDQLLKSRKLGLRIRETDTKRLITLKGPSRSDTEGIDERLELELEWSQESLQQVIEKLRDQGVDTKGICPRNSFEQPLNVMHEFGLNPMQERENARQVREVVHGDGASMVVAELVIDSLTFNIGGHKVAHREIEIEAKGGGSTDTIKSLIEGLLFRFPDDLIRWRHSKLAIGIAVEALYESRRLEGLLNEEDALVPSAYTLIDSYLLECDTESSQ